MKRAIVLLIFILLFAPLVLSQDIHAAQPINNSADDINAGAEAAKNQVNKVSGALEEERPIPEKLQPIVKLFFRFDEKMSISQVIIGVMLFIVLSLFLIGTVKMFGFFSEDFVAPAVGIILALIFSMLGFLKTVTMFLLNIGSAFKILENWGIVWAILALVIIWYVGGKLLSAVRVKNLMQKAYEKGAKAGSDLAFAHAQEESYAEGSGI